MNETNIKKRTIFALIAIIIGILVVCFSIYAYISINRDGNNIKRAEEKILPEGKVLIVPESYMR